MTKHDVFLQVIENIKQKNGLKSDRQVAKLLRIEPNTLANRKLRGNLPYEEIITFCDENNVSLDELLLGKEEKQHKIIPPEIKVVAPEEIKNGLGNIKANDDYMAVPIVGEMAAGNPNLIPETDIEDFALIHVSQIKYTSNPYRYRCVRVLEGSKSMAPLIQPGSLVCIDSHQTDPEKLEKKIVALVDEDGGCTIKRLKVKEKFVIGLPENADYEPVIIPIDGQNPILGKVVWWWSRAE